ncbi:pyroglutamyl-peptidase 1-like [Sabethes cyaneus]|uniref:pyroglutamyl-peptidase 1-like n=1 Tax=Sabethes cyaneus TaxID=53552 RepID=UPI00237D87B5|nr:pyroglutamyl-peptidase 1-like [Sabethes cyaneus]
MSSKVITVTMFIPVDGEERAANWKAVKLLPAVYRLDNEEYAVKKLQIPVTYAAVDDVVPKIWSEKPTLVIHIGFHESIEAVTVEKCASSSGYHRLDFVNKCLPCDEITINSSGSILETKLDVHTIAAELCLSCSNKMDSFLCEYMYLRSLDIDPSRTLFIHVPNVVGSYTSEETRDVLYQVLDRCMRQLDTKEKLQSNSNK